ncbi:signal recognition particle-docking protein FtsY [Aliikangiella marina]|uniref:Signal recognition particle receptor FtsY n=1 Tax=Aliikangiella marina TaxID=1712262 RepID=A0A545T131_9GAMM|nr:signal recognition particle-docking protein FtsY [Aliikangiella marina]TQV70926.1 signal recognition particle-docking protein FtsY [Aliikangiella marina]
MSDKDTPKRRLFGWFSGNKSKQENEIDSENNQVDSNDDISQTEDNIHSEENSATAPKAVVTDKEALTQESPSQESPSHELPNDSVTRPAKSQEEASSPLDSGELDAAENEPKTSFFQRLKRGLSKTRTQFSQGLANLVLGQKEIDEDVLEEVETLLLMADVGVDTTSRIIDDLTEKADRKELKDTEALMARLKTLLTEIVEPVQAPLEVPNQDNPFVILMVGVNGVGKTTTIGKLAHKFLAEGKSVMLAAGDTFRAAAVEQLSAWGERNNVPVIAQHTGADSASVIFDAVEAAKARNVDIVIADTAGRLHNKSNLMEELSKVKRVMAKVDADAPHEVMLVVDAGTGQNALIQAVEFDKAVALNSVTVTKLDGTAKGGVVFALADKMKLPIRFIGVGESKQDLRTFDAGEFIDALFDQ